MRQIFPLTVQPPSGRLLWPDEAPTYIRKSHAESCKFDAIELVELEGVTICGLGLLMKEGELFFPKGLIPPYVERITRKKAQNKSEVDSHVWLGAALKDEWSVKDVDSPVIAPLHPNWVFGHVLLEILPKLVLLDILLPRDIPVAIPSTGPKWMLPLVRQTVPQRELVTYDHKNEVLRPKSVITCTEMSSESGLHVGLRDIFQAMKIRTTLAQPRSHEAGDSESSGGSNGAGLVYISRSKIKHSWHRLASEERIERRLAAKGFEIVHPQTMPFSEQMRVFGSARMIVGEYSSSLHNAVFSPPGTTIVCLNCLGTYQSRIATTFGHTVGYIEPVGGFRGYDDRGSGKPEMELDIRALMSKINPLLAELGVASETGRRPRAQQSKDEDKDLRTESIGIPFGANWQDLGRKVLRGVRTLGSPRR